MRMIPRQYKVENDLRIQFLCHRCQKEWHFGITANTRSRPLKDLGTQFLLPVMLIGHLCKCTTKRYKGQYISVDLVWNARQTARSIAMVWDTCLLAAWVASVPEFTDFFLQTFQFITVTTLHNPVQYKQYDKEDHFSLAEYWETTLNNPIQYEQYDRQRRPKHPTALPSL